MYVERERERERERDREIERERERAVISNRDAAPKHSLLGFRRSETSF